MAISSRSAVSTLSSVTSTVSDSTITPDTEIENITPVTEVLNTSGSGTTTPDTEIQDLQPIGDVISGDSQTTEPTVYTTTTTVPVQQTTTTTPQILPSSDIERTIYGSSTAVEDKASIERGKTERQFLLDRKLRGSIMGVGIYDMLQQFGESGDLNELLDKLRSQLEKNGITQENIDKFIQLLKDNDYFKDKSYEEVEAQLKTVFTTDNDRIYKTIYGFILFRNALEKSPPIMGMFGNWGDTFEKLLTGDKDVDFFEYWQKYSTGEIGESGITSPAPTGVPIDTDILLNQLDAIRKRNGTVDKELAGKVPIVPINYDTEKISKEWLAIIKRIDLSNKSPEEISKILEKISADVTQYGLDTEIITTLVERINAAQGKTGVAYSYTAPKEAGVNTSRVDVANLDMVNNESYMNDWQSQINNYQSIISNPANYDYQSDPPYDEARQQLIADGWESYTIQTASGGKTMWRKAKDVVTQAQKDLAYATDKYNYYKNQYETAKAEYDRLSALIDLTGTTTTETEPITVDSLPVVGESYTEEDGNVGKVASVETDPVTGMITVYVQVSDNPQDGGHYYYYSVVDGKYVRTDKDGNILTTTVETPPAEPTNLGGVYQVSEGVYVERNADGKPISTAYITADSITIDGIDIGRQVFNKATDPEAYYNLLIYYTSGGTVNPNNLNQGGHWVGDTYYDFNGNAVYQKEVGILDENITVRQDIQTDIGTEAPIPDAEIPIPGDAETYYLYDVNGKVISTAYINGDMVIIVGGASADVGHQIVYKKSEEPDFYQRWKEYYENGGVFTPRQSEIASYTEEQLAELVEQYPALEGKLELTDPYWIAKKEALEAQNNYNSLLESYEQSGYQGGGVVKVSEGVYEERNPDGKVISTAYISGDTITIYGIDLVGTQIFNKNEEPEAYYNLLIYYLSGGMVNPNNTNQGGHWEDGVYYTYDGQAYYQIGEGMLNPTPVVTQEDIDNALKRIEEAKSKVDAIKEPQVEDELTPYEQNELLYNMFQKYGNLNEAIKGGMTKEQLKALGFTDAQIEVAQYADIQSAQQAGVSETTLALAGVSTTTLGTQRYIQNIQEEFKEYKIDVWQPEGGFQTSYDIVGLVEGVDNGTVNEEYLKYLFGDKLIQETRDAIAQNKADLEVLKPYAEVEYEYQSDPATDVERQQLVEDGWESYTIQTAAGERTMWRKANTTGYDIDKALSEGVDREVLVRMFGEETIANSEIQSALLKGEDRNTLVEKYGEESVAKVEKAFLDNTGINISEYTNNSEQYKSDIAILGQYAISADEAYQYYDYQNNPATEEERKKLIDEGWESYTIQTASGEQTMWRKAKLELKEFVASGQAENIQYNTIQIVKDVISGKLDSNAVDRVFGTKFLDTYQPAVEALGTATTPIEAKQKGVEDNYIDLIWGTGAAQTAQNWLDTYTQLPDGVWMNTNTLDAFNDPESESYNPSAYSLLTNAGYKDYQTAIELVQKALKEQGYTTDKTVERVDLENGQVTYDTKTEYSLDSAMGKISDADLILLFGETAINEAKARIAEQYQLQYDNINEALKFTKDWGLTPLSSFGGGFDYKSLKTDVAEAMKDLNLGLPAVYGANDIYDIWQSADENTKKAIVDKIKENNIVEPEIIDKEMINSFLDTGMFDMMNPLNSGNLYRLSEAMNNAGYKVNNFYDMKTVWDRLSDEEKDNITKVYNETPTMSETVNKFAEETSDWLDKTLVQKANELWETDSIGNKAAGIGIWVGSGLISVGQGLFIGIPTSMIKTTEQISSGNVANAIKEIVFVPKGMVDALAYSVDDIIFGNTARGISQAVGMFALPMIPKVAKSAVKGIRSSALTAEAILKGDLIPPRALAVEKGALPNVKIPDTFLADVDRLFKDEVFLNKLKDMPVEEQLKIIKENLNERSWEIFKAGYDVALEIGDIKVPMDLLRTPEEIFSSVEAFKGTNNTTVVELVKYLQEHSNELRVEGSVSEYAVKLTKDTPADIDLVLVNQGSKSAAEIKTRVAQLTEELQQRLNKYDKDIVLKDGKISNTRLNAEEAKVIEIHAEDQFINFGDNLIFRKSPSIYIDGIQFRPFNEQVLTRARTVLQPATGMQVGQLFPKNVGRLKDIQRWFEEMNVALEILKRTDNNKYESLKSAVDKFNEVAPEGWSKEPVVTEQQLKTKINEGEPEAKGTLLAGESEAANSIGLDRADFKAAVEKALKEVEQTGKNVIVKIPESGGKIIIRSSPILKEYPNTLFHVTDNIKSWLEQTKDGVAKISSDSELYTSYQAAYEFLKTKAENGKIPEDSGIVVLRTAEGDIGNTIQLVKKYWNRIDANGKPEVLVEGEYTLGTGKEIYATPPNEFSYSPKSLSNGLIGETRTWFPETGQRLPMLWYATETARNKGFGALSVQESKVLGYLAIRNTFVDLLHPHLFNKIKLVERVPSSASSFGDLFYQIALEYKGKSKLSYLKEAMGIVGDVSKKVWEKLQKEEGFVRLSKDQQYKIFDKEFTLEIENRIRKMLDEIKSDKKLNEEFNKLRPDSIDRTLYINTKRLSDSFKAAMATGIEPETMQYQTTVETPTTEYIEDKIINSTPQTSMSTDTRLIDRVSNAINSLTTPLTEKLSREYTRPQVELGGGGAYNDEGDSITTPPITRTTTNITTDLTEITTPRDITEITTPPTTITDLTEITMPTTETITTTITPPPTSTPPPPTTDTIITPPPPPPPPPSSTPPKPPVDWDEEDVKEWKKSGFPAGTITWKQGMFWKVIPPPYDKDRPISMFDPPIGAQNVDATGEGASYKTLQVLGDKVPEDVKVDLGWADVIITTDPETKKPRIQYLQGGLETNVGDREPSNYSGMTILNAPSTKDTAKEQYVSKDLRNRGLKKKALSLSEAIEEEPETKMSFESKYNKPKQNNIKRANMVEESNLDRYYLGHKLPDSGLEVQI